MFNVMPPKNYNKSQSFKSFLEYNIMIAEAIQKQNIFLSDVFAIKQFDKSEFLK